MTFNIRTTQTSDIASLQKIIDATELFPSEMLPDMVSGFLSSGEESQDIWLTCELDDEVMGFCYAIEEQLAQGTWNMLAIAVLPQKQGEGCGSALTTYLESELKAQGQRILIADTSGTAVFEDTRSFYRKNGYNEEARIRDFWGRGDDKVTFWKAL